MAETHAEKIRHPDVALNPSPPRQEKKSGVNWWTVIVVLLVAKVVLLILIAKYRPQWFAKFGIYFGGSGGFGGINPSGWV